MGRTTGQWGWRGIGLGGGGVALVKERGAEGRSELAETDLSDNGVEIGNDRVHDSLVGLKE